MPNHKGDALQKKADEFNKWEILHLDQNELSSSAIGNMFMRWYHLEKKFFYILNENYLLPALEELKTVQIVLVNYMSCTVSICGYLKKARKLYPEISIVIYNFRHSNFEKIALLKAGANILLDPKCNIYDICNKLEQCRADKVTINDVVSEEDLQKASEDVIDDAEFLSEQEIQFIRDSCNGLSHTEIGEKNGLSQRRVHNVFHGIHKKTGCKTPMDILRYAFLHRIITWPERFVERTEAGLNILFPFLLAISSVLSADWLDYYSLL